MRHVFNRPLVLSALLAILGGAATFVALADARGGGPVRPPVPVVVAVRALAVGQPLAATDLLVREFPPEAVPPDSVRAIAEVEGRFVSVPLMKGEPVLLAKLSDRAPGSSLASLIPPGRVAVSVAVSDVVSTGGFVAPGDRVDVLGVTTRETGDVADLVLRDVTVLAVANSLIGAREPAAAARTATARDNPRSLDGTVTLAVTVEEARRLVQVDELGKVRLALRPRADQPALAGEINSGR
ncbi:MAG: Flp pilus assembly protein CpaB [Dehalococcoidia bacterium]